MPAKRNKGPGLKLGPDEERKGPATGLVVYPRRPQPPPREHKLCLALVAVPKVYCSFEVAAVRTRGGGKKSHEGRSPDSTIQSRRNSSSSHKSAGLLATVSVSRRTCYCALPALCRSQAREREHTMNPLSRRRLEKSHTLLSLAPALYPYPPP